MVICLELGADLHMAQLMPPPLTVSCFNKIQIGFTFLVPADPGSPGKRAVKRVCVCVCVCISVLKVIKNYVMFKENPAFLMTHTCFQCFDTAGYNKKQICKGHKVVTSEASVTSTGIRKSVQPVKIE